MPGILPTPQSAALARANPTFFGNLIHTFLTKFPYVAPVYNWGGSLVHEIQGTQGQFGRATTLPGLIAQKLSSNPTGAPSITPSVGGWTIDKDGNLVEAPAASPPAAAQPPPVAPAAAAAPPDAPASVAGAPGPLAKFYQQLYGTGRFPGAPAGAPTLAQAEFPGSAIGPWGGGTINPYSSGDPSNPTRGDQGLGVIASHPGGIPPIAAAIMAYNASRNVA